MSDLTTLRDYCRRMSDENLGRKHTPADRALFATIAAEIDRYLTGQDDPDTPPQSTDNQPGLFE